MKIKSLGLILTISASLFALVSCKEVATQTTAVERDKVEFVTLLQNVRFNGRALAKGDKFEIVRLSKGQIGVFLTGSNNQNFLATYGGLLSTANQSGVVLDRNLCTNGQSIAMGRMWGQLGSLKEGESVGVFDEYTLEEPAAVFDTPVRFCFSRL